jgi:hypothetical protein
LTLRNKYITLCLSNITPVRAGLPIERPAEFREQEEKASWICPTKRKAFWDRC